MISWRVAETNEDRLACYRLRAEQYARHYHNIPPGEFRDEFDDARLPDSRRQAHTIAVVQGGTVVATARVLIAARADLPVLPSELRDLVTVGASGPAWLGHLRRPPAPSCVAVGELSKLTGSRGTLVERSAWLLAAMAGTAEMACREGIVRLVVLMSPTVVRRVWALGVPFERVAGVGLNRDSIDTLRTLVRYADYFLPALAANPEVSQPGFADAAHEAALRQLTTGCEDGAHLYTITVADYVRAVPCWPLLPDSLGTARGASAYGPP
jgi:hypothetical protein